MFLVIYYVGGSEQGTWKRHYDNFREVEHAELQKDILMEMGYAATVIDTVELETNGLPTKPPAWWNFETLELNS